MNLPEATEVTASNVRAAMARKRMSQCVLAAHLGVTQQVLSRRLSGDVPIDVNQLAAIARALGVPVAVLLDGIEPTPEVEAAAS